MSDDLCEYEKQRLEHIAHNHAMLVRLGLVTADEKPVFTMAPSTETKPKQRRVRVPAAPPATLRRSSRTTGTAPEYTRELIDKLGEEMDAPGYAKRQKRQAAKDGEEEEEEDEEAVRAEMLESTTAFLRAAREALLNFVSSADGAAPETTDGWREEARRRWGVAAGADDDARDWEAYVMTRLSKPPPPSPLDLLQEYYAGDMWQLLCACALMSRCSSWNTKHTCISAFFRAYRRRAPGPSSLGATLLNLARRALSVQVPNADRLSRAGGARRRRGRAAATRPLARAIRRPAQGAGLHHAGLPPRQGCLRRRARLGPHSPRAPSALARAHILPPVLTAPPACASPWRRTSRSTRSTASGSSAGSPG